jgi:hypothetical protein
MRLKVQTIKTLVWFAIALLVAAIIGLLVYIFLNVVPVIQDKQKKRSKDLAAKIQKAQDVQPTIKARERTAGIDGSQLDNVRLLNITGRDPPPPEVAVDPTDANKPPPLQPITEVLTVSHIIVSALDASRSFATVKYLGETPAVTQPPTATPPGVAPPRHKPQTLQGYVEVGTTLKSPYDKAPFNGKVVAILEDGVEFEWGGERVKLTPPQLSDDFAESRVMPGLEDGAAVDDSGKIPATDESAAATPRSSRSSTTESIASGTHDWYIGTEELARLESEGEAMLAEIEFATTVVKSENNKMRLQLKKVPEGSLAHQRGFRDGDILRAINGQEMSKQSSIVDYVKSNSGQTRFSIELDRLGSKVTKVFTLAR